MIPLIAVLDACVLFSAVLRDTLLCAAEIGLIRVHWSADILEEVTRNLIDQGRTLPDQAARLVGHMTNEFPSANVFGYQALIDIMTNDEGDRHVLAAAVAVGADVIVTANTRHFPSSALEPFGIEALDPDAMLATLFAIAPDAMIDIIHKQAAELNHPTKTVDEVVAMLADHAPSLPRRFGDLIGREDPTS